MLSRFPAAAALRELAGTDPAAAVARARSLLGDALVDDVERCLVWSTLGRALLDLGDQRSATAAAEQSLAVRTVSDDADVVVPVTMSAAAVFAEGGDVDRALSTLDELRPTVVGALVGRVEIQRAFVLHHAGRLHEAVLGLDAAEGAFGASPESTDRLRLLEVRGLVFLQQGSLDAAQRDLDEALAIARSLGYVGDEALCLGNLAVLHGRARRWQHAVESFARADARYLDAGEPARPMAILEIDRAETLMHAGLLSGALEAAHRAVRRAESTGNRVLLADAHLMLARSSLAAGDTRLARAIATRVEQMLADTGRIDTVPLGTAVRIEADLAMAREETELRRAVGAARVAVAELTASGWEHDADLLRLVTVRQALRTGFVDEVADDLEHLRLGAFSDQRDLALAGWYAEAVARSLAGDLEASLDACRVGLDRLDDLVAEAATLEQRSAAMRIGRDLSQLAVELAVELHDPDTVLAAAEGTRARSLHDEMAERDRHRPLTEAGALQLRGELSTRLADRVLVEWIEARGDIWAVVFGRRGGRLVRVAAVSDVVRAIDRTLVWLDLAAEDPDGSSVRAMRAMALLDELLVAPLDLPPEADVVVVPVGATHAVPWSGLPTLAGRSLTLVPNAQLWLAADRRAAAATRSIGLIIGPDIASADVERTAVEGLKGDLTVAAGAGATAATVRSMFGGLDLVHVAAHGTFRGGQPLLSTLRLHGGESTLYDTVPERVASKLVVLSSCQGGAHSHAEGSEVLGLAAVMLARGAAAVLAPLTVVRELECADFVADVHAQLAGRQPIGAAIASVRRRWLADDDLSRWAVASSFMCFGSDAVTVGT